MLVPTSIHWMLLLLLIIVSIIVVLVNLVLSPPDPSFPKADAIVLLAGDTAERAPVTARVYLDGDAKKVALTNDGVLGGWSNIYNRNLYQIEWATEALVKLGVPRDAIVELPFYGSSTVYDALAVQRYVLTMGWKRIILVTSDYHAWRALWIFKKVFSKDSVAFSVVPAKSFAITLSGYILESAKIGYYLMKYGLFGFFPKIDAPVLK